MNRINIPQQKIKRYILLRYTKKINKFDIISKIKRKIICEYSIYCDENFTDVLMFRYPNDAHIHDIKQHLIINENIPIYKEITEKEYYTITKKYIVNDNKEYFIDECKLEQLCHKNKLLPYVVLYCSDMNMQFNKLKYRFLTLGLHTIKRKKLRKCFDIKNTMTRTEFVKECLNNY